MATTTAASTNSSTDPSGSGSSPVQAPSGTGSQSISPKDALTVPELPELGGSKDYEIIDTHCHLAHTYDMHKDKYKEEFHFNSITDLVNQVYPAQNVKGVVDVWCECPPESELLSKVREELSNIPNFSYNYVIGVHPESAAKYTDADEAAIVDAYKDKRCVGWGEIGLDYHYMSSPKDKQIEVLRRQLRKMKELDLGKALTIHTREADEDIYQVLIEEVPKETHIHIHCFTDTPELAQKLLDHFPNLFIGVTGVVTYSSNKNTIATVKNLAKNVNIIEERKITEGPSPFRIVLETDSPYMIPGNLERSKKKKKKTGTSLKVSHSAMIPYTCEFLVKNINQDQNVDIPEDQINQDSQWTALDILRIGRRNAKFVYGV